MGCCGASLWTCRTPLASRCGRASLSAMAPRFSPCGEAGERLPMPDAEVRLWLAAFAPDEASQLLDTLTADIAWRQEDVLIFGERRPVPRLVAWHGDPGASYTYSGTPHDPLPWTRPLEQIRSRIFELTGNRFNSVLLNQYRDGRDGMARGRRAGTRPRSGHCIGIPRRATKVLLPPPSRPDPEARRDAVGREPAADVGRHPASLGPCRAEDVDRGRPQAEPHFPQRCA